MNFYPSAKHPDNEGISIASLTINKTRDTLLYDSWVSHKPWTSKNYTDLSVPHILATPGHAANPPGRESTGSAIWLIQVALAPTGRQMTASVVSVLLCRRAWYPDLLWWKKTTPREKQLGRRHLGNVLLAEPSFEKSNRKWQVEDTALCFWRCGSLPKHSHIRSWRSLFQQCRGITQFETAAGLLSAVVTLLLNFPCKNSSNFYIF